MADHEPRYGFCRAFVLRIIAFLDMSIGLITLFATLPAVIVILTSKEPFAFKLGAIDQIRIIGTFSIAFFALVEIVSGVIYLYTNSCWGPKSFCFDFKSFVFLVLELCEFAVPFFVVQNYLEIVDSLIVAPGYHCWILYLLKVNPLTIGLFVYQIIAFLIVLGGKDRGNGDGTLQRKRQRSNSLNQRNSIPLLPMTVCMKPTLTQIQDGGGGATAPKYPTLRSFQLDGSAVPGTSRTISENLYSVNTIGCFSESTSMYQQLRSNCLKSGILYEDPDFPATYESLQTQGGKKLKWKRPHEIVANPKFFSGSGFNGVSRFDVRQGMLGDCWLLAAIANLTLRHDFFHRVVPEDNAEDLKDKNQYAGICHFRFCHNGYWKEVIIDDRLPTIGGRLVYMTSADVDEFWSCLLEKAYAKFFGSYQNLSGGKAGVAMSHFTGGTVEDIYLQNSPIEVTALFQMMDSALAAGNLIGASITKIAGQTLKMQGLVGGHAYSITAVKRIVLRSRGTVMLVRIRNPWGNYMEWKGAWSDGHHLWEYVDKRTRKDLEVIFDEDGEFWFPLKEFKNYFYQIQICYINSNV